ncbi:hypothetical protein Syun_014324 [Stephania yunnanensis]|uniref:Uncharacterized protein n=1 Tax=Stephania yunnanensis TaxID=152371 RepID=A0AAP0P9F7_9MAGN
MAAEPPFVRAAAGPGSRGIRVRCGWAAEAALLARRAPAGPVPDRAGLQLSAGPPGPGPSAAAQDGLVSKLVSFGYVVMWILVLLWVSLKYFLLICDVQVFWVCN